MVLGAVMAVVGLIVSGEARRLVRARINSADSRPVMHVTSLGLVVYAASLVWLGWILQSLPRHVPTDLGTLVAAIAPPTIVLAVVEVLLTRFGYPFWRAVQPQANQPLHPTPTAAEAPASGAGERRRCAA